MHRLLLIRPVYAAIVSEQVTERALGSSEKDVHLVTESCACRSWRREDEERVLLHGSSSRGISRKAYLLQWIYETASHPPAALEHMLLLGYQGEPSVLFAVSAPRRLERKPEAPRRSTFQVSATI